MIISFIYPAGKFERFSPEAADGLIGQTFSAKLEQDSIGEGHVIEAKVINEGRALDLIIEWPDDPVSKKLLEQEPFKFGRF